MDSASGLYGYVDLDNLWTYSPTVAALSGQGVSISADDARTIADQFLQDRGLMPGDGLFVEVFADTISGGDIVSGTVSEMSARLLADPEPVVYQVIYGRVLTYTPPGQIGAQQTISFPVAGPGAMQKVFVSPQGPQAGALNANGSAILGAVGGWREMQEQQAEGDVQIETVEILTPAQIYELHDALEEVVVLDPPNIEADGREILEHTLVYWEDGPVVGQSESIPAYRLRVRYTQEGEEVAVSELHIPANETYMRPLARIDSGPTGKVNVGDTVTFTAADATKLLSDLGYDASLNFALGRGPLYTYEWYVGSVEEANKINATGRTIEYTVLDTQQDRERNPTQTIILQVTDRGNPDLASTTAAWTLDLYGRVLLPIVVGTN
jgi:hypothetical protein